MKTQKYICVIFFSFFTAIKESQSCFSDSQYQSISVKTGSSFYQECHCIEAEDSVNSLKWIDPNGHEIKSLRSGTKSNVFTEKQVRSVSIHIPQISKTTAGSYKCITSHRGERYTRTFKIEAYDPVYFVDTKEEQYAIAGQDSIIRCVARGETEPLITWYRELTDDDELRIIDDDKYDIEEDGLKIKQVNDDDFGTYKCTASVLETGEEVEKSIKVQVLLLPIIEEIKVTPNKTVVAGQNITIECLASGLPHPEYTWTKTSEKISPDNETWRQEINTITFDSIEPSDRGIYECQASNTAGETKKEVSIEVLIPPMIEEFSNITASEGSTVQIICKASGRSLPQFIVYYTENDGLEQDKDSIINDFKKVSDTESMSVLTFKSVKRHYAGIYVCNASNEVDSVEEAMQMTVLYKPYFEVEHETVWGWDGQSVNLSCAHESNPPATISWRFQGNDIQTEEQVAINKLLNPDPIPDIRVSVNIDRKSLYGIYECIASNEFGIAKKTITLREAFTPSAIQNVTIRDITATTVTFDIEKPSIVNGPPILGYTAEYDEEENYKITSIHRNRTWSLERPCRVTKLKPDTIYYFKFAAINEVGSGSWSETLKLVTLERSVPEEPIWEGELNSIVLAPEKDGQVIKWKVQENEEDPIDHFVIKYCPVIDDSPATELCKEDLIGPTSQIDLNHLDQNTTYHIQLVAHNSKGNSSAAELYITIPAKEVLPSTLSAEAMIGLTVVIVVFFILALDVMLYFLRRQGLIATCYGKSKRNKKTDNSMSRDKKGLLIDSSNPTSMGDTLKAGHKEFEYNKQTGVITGKHSSV